MYICLSGVFQKTKDQYGHIDVVVNNAGISDETMPQKIVDINVVTIAHIAQPPI